MRLSSNCIQSFFSRRFPAVMLTKGPLESELLLMIAIFPSSILTQVFRSAIFTTFPLIPLYSTMSFSRRAPSLKSMMPAIMLERVVCSAKEIASPTNPETVSAENCEAMPVRLSTPAAAKTIQRMLNPSRMLRMRAGGAWARFAALVMTLISTSAMR